MIPEKLIELLILEKIITQTNGNNVLEFNNKYYDNKKLFMRFTELLEEFLVPYAIESTSKEN